MNIVTNINRMAVLAFIGIGSMLLTGCLGDTGNDTEQNVIEIGVELNGVEEPIKAGEDSLDIEEVKFVHGLSYLVAEEDSLYFSSQPSVFEFSELGGSEDVLAFGQISPNVYSSIDFFISRAPEEMRSVAPEFVTEEARYSMIIEGSYNDEDFQFRTEENFETKFELSPSLTVDEETAESFNMLIFSNIRDWFLAEDGESLINPEESDSTRQLINENIDEAFFLEQQ